MTSLKSERLLNLVILLLVSRNYVSKERIRETIEPYRTSSHDAFEKMFERDKDDLRALGIPIEVGYLDKFFEDEQGYRIKRDAFELPDLQLEPDELAVLGLAARVWQHAGLASATTGALVKLRAAGHEIDREELDTLQPRLLAEEPAFDAMWTATLERRPIEFSYRRPGDQSARKRHLQPWGVATVRGRWYVVGHDLDRDGSRSFRLSRVEGEVRPIGRAGSYEVPDGTDVRALTASLAGVSPEVVATVLARTGAAQGLRRRAEQVETGVAGPDTVTGWDRLVVRGSDREDLVRDLLGHADSVFVEEPADVRERVVARLQALVVESA